jgi:hypothetical protein
MRLSDIDFNGRLMSCPSLALAAALCLCHSLLDHQLTLVRSVRPPRRIPQRWTKKWEHRGPGSPCLFLLCWLWALPLLSAALPRASLLLLPSVLALRLHGARRPAVGTSPPPRSRPGPAMHPAIVGLVSIAGCALSATRSVSMSGGG